MNVLIYTECTECDKILPFESEELARAFVDGAQYGASCYGAGYFAAYVIPGDEKHMCNSGFTLEGINTFKETGVAPIRVLE